MRDEKEGRKKQAWSNKQQGKATQQTHMYTKLSTCIYNVPGERVAVLAGVLVLHDIGVISQFGTW